MNKFDYLSRLQPGDKTTKEHFGCRQWQTGHCAVQDSIHNWGSRNGMAFRTQHTGSTTLRIQRLYTDKRVDRSDARF